MKLVRIFQLAVMLCLFFILFGCAGRQAVPNSGAAGSMNQSGIISKSNVTKDVLFSLFKNAYFNIEHDPKGGMLITDTFKIYLDIDKGNRFITFSVYWPIVESFSLQDKYQLINKLNTEILLVSPYIMATGKTIIVKYDLWIEGGVTAENIIQTERIFLDCLKTVLKRDVQKIIK